LFQAESALTQKQRETMAALAEEHNYFAPETRVSSDIDPLVLLILEEHNYR